MWAFTSETSFPALIDIPQSHISLIDNFFRTVDGSSQDRSKSKEFATIFTSDGVWKNMVETLAGIDQIMQTEHRQANQKIVKSMRHWVLKVYAHDESAKELMLLGRIRVDATDGTARDVNFGARLEIETVVDGEHEEGNSPRLKFFQGWSSTQ